MNIRSLLPAALVALCSLVSACRSGGPRSSPDDVTVETKTFRLVIGADARAKSLVVKATGEEMLDTREGIALFSTTQERPFNNEIKLANPNKRTTYQANRVRREGDTLVIGFAVAPYEAVVRVKEGAGFAAFTLVDFRTDVHREKQYGGLKMDAPPVASFRLLQLPVARRRNFGDWLNVSWDERAAVAVIAGDPYVSADHEDRFGFRLLNADLQKGLKLRGGTAVIVAGAGEKGFLGAMEGAETALGLPNGVRSRRSPLLNASIYWTASCTPANVDEHIAWAKKGGFRMMLLYYPCFTKGGSYRQLGDYDWRKEYPNGEKDVAAMLTKIRDAGITPGFHTLQTHIGLASRYVTPVADPRLNKTRLFTLAKALPAEAAGAEIEVCENPVDSVMFKDCRILQFGGELVSYESYTVEPPYRFLGVKRGHLGTRITAHEKGEIGGILDVSEYGASSCYLDQRTDLQDEIAEKIAKICDAGMEFCYFDGSEGVNPPCNVNVSLSQYRVVKKFQKMPLFTEGAAKSHFGWHLQAGANAFDVFRPEVFKEKIVEYPLAEAPVMRQDFTRLDFGWWRVWSRGRLARGGETIGTQPDMWEFGTSKAAAWDCPATVQASPEAFARHRRAEDILAVMRRWEDVRSRELMTDDWRAKLRDPNREFHLLENGRGGYELVEWWQLDVAGGKWTDVRAFVYEKDGKRVVEYWHVSDAAKLRLPLGKPTVLEADNVKTFTTELSMDEVKRVFAAAEILAP